MYIVFGFFIWFCIFSFIIISLFVNKFGNPVFLTFWFNLELLSVICVFNLSNICAGENSLFWSGLIL